MNQQDVKVMFYLKKSEADAKGNCPVMGRISIGRYSEAAFSAKIKVKESMWSMGRAHGHSSLVREINQRLDEIRATVLNIYNEQTGIRETVSAEEIKSLMLGMASEQSTLLKYFEDYIDRFAKRVGVNRTKGSLLSYRNAYRHLSNFLKVEYNLSDIPFTALDRSFIDKYDLYLKTVCHLAPSSIINLTRYLRGIIGEAIADGIITANPFMGYEAERPKTKQKYLTEEELNRIMTTPLNAANLYLVRDLFIFSCYTGIPYGDMARLTEDDLSVAEDGQSWIKSSRKKTTVDYEVPLLDLPMQIIEKYRGTGPDGKLFPMYGNDTINKYLKRIAKLCGIERHLVFHAARHTYATEVTLAHGVPIETVSRMLGHSRIQTTQIYAKVTDEKISTDTSALDEKLAERFKVVI